MLKNITNSNRQERSDKFFLTQIWHLALTTGSRTPHASSLAIERSGDRYTNEVRMTRINRKINGFEACVG